MLDVDTHDLTRIMARYLRYERNCPVLALECPCRLNSVYNDGGSADLLAVDNSRYLIEIEIKVSISDLRADQKKEKHEYYKKCLGLPYKNWEKSFGARIPKEPNVYPTHLFYYAFPESIVNDARFICDQLYPYAGILYPTETRYYSGVQTTVQTVVVHSKRPRAINPDKITVKQAMVLVKSQSASLVRQLDTVGNYKKLLMENKKVNE